MPPATAPRRRAPTTRSPAARSTFGAGETTKTFTVPLLDDALAEGVETVTLQLSGPGGGATLGARTHRGAAHHRRREVAGIQRAELRGQRGRRLRHHHRRAHRRVAEHETTITVNYATSNGTATAGLDYTSGQRYPGLPARRHADRHPDTDLHGADPAGHPGRGHRDGRTSRSARRRPSGVAQLVTARSTAILSIDDDDQGGKIEFDVPVATPVQTFTALEGAGWRPSASSARRPAARLASGVTVDYATSRSHRHRRSRLRRHRRAADVRRRRDQPHVHGPAHQRCAGRGDRDREPGAARRPGGGGALGSAATAVLDIQDDEPHVKLSAATYTVSEGAGFLTVTVERGGVDTATLTVDYATADQFPAGAGKAVAGVDYTAVTGTLTFAPAVRTRTFTVPILNDSMPEPDDKFDVLLRNATISSGTVTIVAPARAEVNITDDDFGGTIQFSSATYTVNEDGGDADRHRHPERRPGRRRVGAPADRRPLRGDAPARSPDRQRAGRLHLHRRARDLRPGRDHQDRAHPHRGRRGGRGRRDALRPAERSAARRHAGGAERGPAVPGHHLDRGRPAHRAVRPRDVHRRRGPAGGDGDGRADGAVRPAPGGLRGQRATAPPWSPTRLPERQRNA